MIDKISELAKSGAGQFFIAVLVVLGLWLAWSLRGISWKKYFSTEDGKGVLKSALFGVGCVLAIVVAAVLLGGCAPTVTKYGTLNNGASAFAGLDYTKFPSPQCEETGPDDRTTSNLGLRYFLYQSTDEKFNLNLKYTHHSCAFNPDDELYDAGGVELEYKLW